MLYLHRRKTVTRRSIILTVLLSLSFLSQAQNELFLEEHDLKPYYFGITLGMNVARFQSELHPHFLNQDSILIAEPLNSGGFQLGLLATAKLTNRFEARFNPQLMFTERSIYYRQQFSDLDAGLEVTKPVESVIVSFPLQLKFRSDRIGNFRVYMMGGGKMDYDLASNARARRAENQVKIEKIDMGIEGGLGFNFYFRSFIFSPEIKFSNGLRNLHARDERLKYSSVLDQLKSRMIVFSIHLEG
jgi:hypothetical protein